MPKEKDKREQSVGAVTQVDELQAPSIETDQATGQIMFDA